MADWPPIPFFAFDGLRARMRGLAQLSATYAVPVLYSRQC